MPTSVSIKTRLYVSRNLEAAPERTDMPFPGLSQPMGRIDYEVALRIFRASTAVLTR
jgi:hypothetical protein